MSKNSNDSTDWAKIERIRLSRTRHGRIVNAALDWARIVRNPKTIRVDLLEAERRLLEAVGEP